MVFWDYKVYFAGERGCQIFYEIPHHRETVYGEWRIEPGIHPFAVGPWRAPAANTNLHARDLHINFTASRAGKDPLGYRLSHLKDQRMRRVLEAAIICMGAVLATAVYDATGAKMLQLPMTPRRVKEALKKV